jgi:L-methionine (R)-S-oxide reductase
MVEKLIVHEHLSKKERYEQLLPQLVALVASETDLIANLANISSALHAAFGWHWVGFYLVKNNELVVGPFQGPPACTRIAYNKGVCGTAWARAQIINVANVHEFAGHIACSAQSQSEIVVPIFNQNNVVGVLDIDSSNLADFDEVDELYLMQATKIVSTCYNAHSATNSVINPI